MPLRFKRNTWYLTGATPHPQDERVALSLLVRRIYDNDYNEKTNPTGLTPLEQQAAIKKLVGMSRREMIQLLPHNDIKLAESIRKLLSERKDEIDYRSL